MAEPGQITTEEIDEVYPKVAQHVAEALGRDLGEVALGSRLIEDLEAESIDSLDIVFRLERAFRIKVPRGKIIEEARGPLSESEFEKKGVLTEAGRQRLQQYMSEVPPERFPKKLKVADLPMLFTVETFCKLVVRALRAKTASPAPSPQSGAPGA